MENISGGGLGLGLEVPPLGLGFGIGLEVLEDWVCCEEVRCWVSAPSLREVERWDNEGWDLKLPEAVESLGSGWVRVRVRC